MAKYTEAFCVTTGSMISITQMRSEYNHDPAVYEKVYKGHLFCPGCQAVPLTVVHTNGQLYYRGHPHEKHADGCWYALDERVLTPPTIEIVGFLGGAARFIAKPCLKQRVMWFPIIHYGCSA